jgi:hypothetical protein
MALDTEAIEDAIFAEFQGDADLLAALGGSPGRFYPEEAPERPTSPYVIYTLITGFPDPTFTSDGEVLAYQFTVFNKDIDEPLNRDTINDVIKKLTAAYDDATLAITGHTSIGVTRGVYGSLPTLDNVQQWMTNYEIMIEDD